jgi:hypothetical protein
VSHETAIPKSNIWREAGVPIPDVSTLVGATGGTLGVKSVSALAFELKSCAPDATTNEGDIGRSVAEENKPVGSAQREATGDCAVSGEAFFGSFCPAPLGSTDGAGVVGEMFTSASTKDCGNDNSAWVSAAERASLAALSGATSGAARQAGLDVVVWEEVSPSSRKYQHWRLVPRSLR